jgi:dimethylhistidine N-methyltransferase
MSTPHSAAFAEDVRHGLQLTPRQLPSKYLYDPLGSALFDAICELPWYGITRAELRLLCEHRTQILSRFPGLAQIIELGPGDGRKLLTLVRGTSTPVVAHLVDLSASALARAAHTLSAAAHVGVIPHEMAFDAGLDAIPPASAGGRSLVMFLGSNIGNFDAAAALDLLRLIRRSLAPGDGFLLGADLVKPERDLLLAYDDPLGVSAAFNLNILQRINRELRANFDVHAFRHRAIWNADCSRMDMFVVSMKRQRVRIDDLELEIVLDNGEPIWTESSSKYTPDDLTRMLQAGGFTPAAQWIDSDDGFALSLVTAS